MSLIIQKYGGSSVGTPEKIKGVAQRIAALHKQGHGVLIVVSAMGDTTDDLIALADEVTEEPFASRHEREMDVLLSSGERIAMALLSIALRDLKIEAKSFTGSQAGIITDESHTRAKILAIKPERIQKELNQGSLVIVAGFQGVSQETKEITTLGRGGSDTTAVALAVALGASRCEILTDVSGIYSADPRIVPDARHYEKLSFEQVLALALGGAQVMHPRSLEIARQHGLDLWVGHSRKEKEGTWIMKAVSEKPQVIGVTHRMGLQAFAIEKKGKDLQNVLEIMAGARPIIHGWIEGEKGIQVLLDPLESQGMIEKQGWKPNFPAVLITVVGHQIQQEITVICQVEEILSKRGFSVLQLTADFHSIKIWIKDEDESITSRVADVVRELHEKLIPLI